MAGNDDLDEGQRALSDGESVAVPSRDGSDSDDGAPKLPPAVRKLADTLSSGERDGAPSTAGLNPDAPRQRRKCAPVPKTPRPPRREGKAPPPKRARAAPKGRRGSSAPPASGLAACKMDWFRRQQRTRWSCCRTRTTRLPRRRTTDSDATREPRPRRSRNRRSRRLRCRGDRRAAARAPRSCLVRRRSYTLKYLENAGAWRGHDYAARRA